MQFLFKKTALSILLLWLSLLPSYGVQKINSLEINPININGSLIDQNKNTLTILKAKELNLLNEITIKRQYSKEKYKLQGIFTTNGDLEINITDIGFEGLLRSDSLIIAATDGRKKYASEISYIAPIIVRGSIEIPTRVKDNNLSNATISIHDPITKEKFNQINTIASNGEIKTSLVNSKPFSRIIYPLFVEIPGTIGEKQNLFEINAEFTTNIKNQKKSISLSSYIDLRDLLNKNHNILQGVKLSPSTSISVNLISSTIDELKSKHGDNSHIPGFYELYLEILEIFADADIGLDIENSIEKAKYLLSDNKEDLFTHILNFIKESKSVLSPHDAEEIASNIYFKPNIISNKKENNNTKSIYFDEIVKALEKNSKKSDSTIIKNLL